MTVKKIALTGAAALALVAGGTAAGAAITGGPVDGSGVVHGCYTSQQVNGSHVVVLQETVMFLCRQALDSGLLEISSNITVKVFSP